mmetsp:Transcript_32077/g.92160  ORF Transcript_32077/g.92160 Transcript_32077/m.92160 type:complete len:246 (+) Transcript_32077:21-758(+)
MNLLSLRPSSRRCLQPHERGCPGAGRHLRSCLCHRRALAANVGSLEAAALLLRADATQPGDACPATPRRVPRGRHRRLPGLARGAAAVPIPGAARGWALGASAREGHTEGRLPRAGAGRWLRPRGHRLRAPGRGGDAHRRRRGPAHDEAQRRRQPPPRQRGPRDPRPGARLGLRRPRGVPARQLRPRPGLRPHLLPEPLQSPAAHASAARGRGERGPPGTRAAPRRASALAGLLWPVLLHRGRGH